MRRGKRPDQPKTGLSFYKGTILVLGLVLAVILFLAAAKEPQFASTINTKAPQVEESEPETPIEDSIEVRSLTGEAFLESLVADEPEEMTDETEEVVEQDPEELEDESYITDSQDLNESEPVAGEEPRSSSSTQPVYKRPVETTQPKTWKRPQQTEPKKPVSKPKTTYENKADSSKVDSTQPDPAEVDTTRPQTDTTTPVEEPGGKEPEQPKEPEQTEEDKPVETPAPVTPVEPEPEQPPASPEEPESPQLDTTMPAVDSSEQ